MESRIPAHKALSFYFNELKEKQKPIEPVILSSSQAADLLVRASEPDSEIYINDVYKGKAPLLIQKVEPKKPIKVSAKTATSSGTDEVTLEPGELREITVSMAPLRGNLVIIANESDVEVLIDGEARGPIGSGVFRALPLGLHNVELVGKDSYYSQKAEIRADTTTQMTATLTPVGSIDIRIPTDALAKLHIGSEIRIIEGPGIVRNLPEGNYYIEAGGKDYVSAMAFLNVRKGQEVSWEPYKNGSISFDVLTKGSTLFIKELQAILPRDRFRHSSWAISWCYHKERIQGFRDRDRCAAREEYSGESKSLYARARENCNEELWRRSSNVCK